MRPKTDISHQTYPVDPLELITSFSIEMGSITELGALSECAIQVLCRAAGSTRGALYLLDREHECYRRSSLVGPNEGQEFPSSLPTTHALPQYLTNTARSAHRQDHRDQEQPDIGSSLAEMLSPFNAVYALPHMSRSRLMAFSLLSESSFPSQDHNSVHPLLNALAQAATNAIDTLILYDDLHRSHLLMKRTDRLKSLETIAGGFAHEIRNPLTSIKTFIQLAPERKDDPDFIREFSKIVLDDVYRIERLIEEILDYARYMEPKLTEEDINDIVSSCLYFIDVKADSHGVKIEKELAQDLPRVMLDRQQLKQVFLNLFLNALDAMSARGGTLQVRTTKRDRPGGKSWVQIETSDTGHGIQETNLEHIFDPFFTTKHESGEHEGTGLGLTIVHQIIQEHHGEIRVTSAVDKGTTFVISLPAIPE